MTFRMESDAEKPGLLRFTLGCECGARRTWSSVACYVAWRAAVVLTGWKADWPETCPACRKGGNRQAEFSL